MRQPVHDAPRRGVWPEPTPLRDKIYDNPGKLRKTTASVRAKVPLSSVRRSSSLGWDKNFQVLVGDILWSLFARPFFLAFCSPPSPLQFYSFSQQTN